MRLAVLDAGLTFPPGETDAHPDPWAPLRELGELTVWEHSPPERIPEQIGTAEVVLSNSITYDHQLLSELPPSVRLICLISTGTDKIDLDAARRRGISVCSVADYATAAVAEHVFALLFALLRRTESHDAAVTAGRWGASGRFSYWESRQGELYGKRIGLVGFGRIARAVATRAAGFGMQVAAARRTPHRGSSAGEVPVVPRAPDPLAAPVPAVDFLPLDELVSTCDILSLHAPLTPDTRGILDKQRIGRMRRGAIVINTARGGLIDEQALAAGLRDGRIAGAGVDVLAREPAPGAGETGACPLIGLDTCIITPHLAWVTGRARERLVDGAVRGIRGWAAGG